MMEQLVEFCEKNGILADFPAFGGFSEFPSPRKVLRKYLNDQEK